MNDDEDENAAELQFGKEFGPDIQTLSNDEVFFILSKKVQDSNYNPSETFQQTYTYLEKVATTKNFSDLAEMATEIALQLRNLELELNNSKKKTKLHPFEIASLANLIRAEEIEPGQVGIWIPSLSRYSDDEIMKAVNIVIEAKERYSDTI